MIGARNGRSTSSRWNLAHIHVGFVQAHPTEAFCAGHVAAIGFVGKVPQSILYDNIRFPVAWVLGNGRRQRTRVCSELESHYLFGTRGKSKVEGLVGFICRIYLVPLPRADKLVHPTRFW